MRLTQPITVCAVTVVLAVVSLKLKETAALGHSWTSLVLLVPWTMGAFGAAVTLVFPCVFLLSTLATFALPRSYLTTSTKEYLYFDAEKNNENETQPIPDYGLTIQVPVYDEPFSVIEATLMSCLRARAYAHSCQVRCNIVVNDDGLFKFLHDDLTLFHTSPEVTQRLAFYLQHQLGVTARAFKGRLGRFKKAGNLNFALRLAKDGFDPDSTGHVHVDFWRKSLVLGQVAFHELVVLVDADSTVPLKVCEFSRLFAMDPLLAYTQHETKPQLSSGSPSLFERAIGLFTEDLFEVAFPLVTRGGDICPLIGHNVLLRTSALLEWAEDRVSEDFAQCLGLHAQGFHGAFVAAAEADYCFSEMVSLCFRDECAKYCKFAFGASEIMWNPIPEWRLKKSLLTPGIKTFVRARTVPWTSKLGILAYMSTYFTLACVVPGLPTLLLLARWSPRVAQAVFPALAQVFLVSTLVFGLVSPAATWFLRFKTAGRARPIQDQMFLALVMMCLLSSSVIPIFKGVTGHLAARRSMNWGSTPKELNRMTRFNLLHAILRQEVGRFVWVSSVAVIALFLVQWPDWLTAAPIAQIVLVNLASPFVFEPRLWQSKVQNPGEEEQKVAAVALVAPVAIHFKV